MKSIVISAIMLIISILLFSHTTFAWFTDDVSIKDNQIVLGKLDMNVTFKDPCQDQPFIPFYEDGVQVQQLFDLDASETSIQPGDQFTRHVKIENTGDITLAVRTVITNTILNETLDENVTIVVDVVNHEDDDYEVIDLTTDYLKLEEDEMVVLEVTLKLSEDLDIDEVEYYVFDFDIEARQINYVQQAGGTIIDLNIVEYDEDYDYCDNDDRDDDCDNDNPGSGQDDDDENCDNPGCRHDDDDNDEDHPGQGHNDDDDDCDEDHPGQGHNDDDDCDEDHPGKGNDDDDDDCDEDPPGQGNDDDCDEDHPGQGNDDDDDCDEDHPGQGNDDDDDCDEDHPGQGNDDRDCDDD